MGTSRLPTLWLVCLLAACRSKPLHEARNDGAVADAGHSGADADAGHGGTGTDAGQGGAEAGHGSAGGSTGGTGGPNDHTGGASGSTRGAGGPNDHTGGASGSPGATQTDLVFALDPVRQLDLLFMVDNSDSMRQEQEGLSAGFPLLINELAGVPGGLPDLHVAIISSNLGAGPNTPAPACRPYGDRGKFLVKPGCGLDAAASPWLQIDGAGMKNFVGTLPDVFGCMVKLGVDGCGYEHQLQA